MSYVDARLAVPAAAAWAAAAVAVGLRPTTTSRVVAVTAIGLLLAVVSRRLGVAAALAGVVLATASALLHVSAAQSGPVAALARAHGHATVVMTLVRDPRSSTSGHGRSFVLADATVDAVGTRVAHSAVLVIAHGGGWLDLLPGQRLRVTVRFAPPRSSDGISAVAFASGPPTLQGRPPWWQRAAGAVRARLRTACSELPADERGLVPGLVVGDVSAMPPSLTGAFRASGLTHLNAVSGENCAIVLGALGAVVRRTPLSRGWRFVVAGAGLAAFVVLARPSPSVLRAAVMGAVALAAGAFGRRTQPLPLLSAAVLVLVLVDPFLSRSAGFALSVLATAAIVLLSPAMTAGLSRRMPRTIAAAIAVPAAAQLACTPVLVVVFGQLSPWAVPANLLAAPAVAPATIAGVCAAVCGAVAVPGAVLVASMLASLLASLAAVPAGWLALVARLFATLPGARAGPSADAIIAVAVVAAIAVAWRLGGRRLHAMLGAWPP